MPPALAIAIAIFDSVTVSIAEDNKGIFKDICFDNCIFVSTYEGSTSEYFGAKVTSSNVSASLIGPIIMYIRFLKN